MKSEEHPRQQAFNEVVTTSYQSIYHGRRKRKRREKKDKPLNKRKSFTIPKNNAQKKKIQLPFHENKKALETTYSQLTPLPLSHLLISTPSIPLFFFALSFACTRSLIPTVKKIQDNIWGAQKLHRPTNSSSSSTISFPTPTSTQLTSPNTLPIFLPSQTTHSL